MDTRVFQYGLLRPTKETEALVEDKLREAHRFYNDCIEYHQETRRAIWALDNDEVKAQAQVVNQLVAERGKLREEINKLRSSEPEEGKEEHFANIEGLCYQADKVLTPQIDKQRKLLKQLRSKQWKAQPQLKVLQKGFVNVARSKIKVRRKGLYWGMYNAVGASAEQANEDSLRLPRFQSYTGEGTLSVMMAQGNAQHQDLIFVSATVPKANQLLQINPVDPRAWEETVPRGERKRLQRTHLRFRVGSDAKGHPLWAEFPMILHRPLPAGALVVGASVTRRKKANWPIWTVQITVKQPLAIPVKPEDVKVAVGIDLGWRSEPGGLRVGYWVDSNGQHGEFLLPTTNRERESKARSLKSIRDKAVDLLRGRLHKDLSLHREALDDTPGPHGAPSLREQVSRIFQWKSPQRFARLWFRYKDQLRPFLSDEGPAEPFRQDPHLARYSNYLEAWVHRDRHLWQYETGLRRGRIGQRNDLMANWADELVSRVDLIAVEDLGLRILAKKAKPERKKAKVNETFAAIKNAADDQRVLVAPGKFRSILVNAAKRAGKLIVAVDKNNTSAQCADCGCICKLGIGVIHTCPQCGRTFDRDHNAGRNILARGLVLLQDPVALAKANLVKEPGPSHWEQQRQRAAKAKECAVA